MPGPANWRQALARCQSLHAATSGDDLDGKRRRPRLAVAGVLLCPAHSREPPCILLPKCLSDICKISSEPLPMHVSKQVCRLTQPGRHQACLACERSARLPVSRRCSVWEAGYCKCKPPRRSLLPHARGVPPFAAADEKPGASVIAHLPAPEGEVLRARAAGRVHHDGVLLGEVAAQQRLGQARLELALHCALHWPRAIHWVVPLGLHTRTCRNLSAPGGAAACAAHRL